MSWWFWRFIETAVPRPVIEDGTRVAAFTNRPDQTEVETRRVL